MRLARAVMLAVMSLLLAPGDCPKTVRSPVTASGPGGLCNKLLTACCGNPGLMATARWPGGGSATV